MIRSSGIYKMYKKVEMEVDNNKELVCAGSEAAMMLFPIMPATFFNRLLIVCFYVLLYNVNAHDRYFEMKGRFLNDSIKNNNIVIANEETDSEEEITLLDDMDIETDEVEDEDEDEDEVEVEDEDEVEGEDEDEDEVEDEDDSSYRETDDGSNINDGEDEDDDEDDGEDEDDDEDEDDGESKKDK